LEGLEREGGRRGRERGGALKEGGRG